MRKVAPPRYRNILYVLQMLNKAAANRQKRWSNLDKITVHIMLFFSAESKGYVFIDFLPSGLTALLQLSMMVGFHTVHVIIGSGFIIML
jgi:hypothetical protein